MKILILSARLPYPCDTGAKIRAFQLMKALASRHQVTLLTFYGHPKEECHFSKIKEMGVTLVPILRRKIDQPVGVKEVVSGVVSCLPFTVTKYSDPRMRTSLAKLIPTHDAIHCEHMHMAQYLTEVQGKIKILDAHNVEAQIAARLVNIEKKNLIKRILLSLNSRLMHRYEKEICRMFDLVLAVSKQDHDIYASDYLAKNVRIMENGVDLEHFKKASPDIHEQLKLVFVGLMEWMPNKDGVKFFVADILPKIKKEFPEVKLDLVGKDPPEDVARLSDLPGVRVTGTVDDIRPYVWDSMVYVVPLRFGGGTRLKILEAFAMHKPVVSTALGCEGIQCTHDKELMIADTPKEFAEAVITLLKDASLRKRLSDNASMCVKENYGWQSLGRKLLTYYDELLLTGKMP